MKGLCIVLIVLVTFLMTPLATTEPSEFPVELDFHRSLGLDEEGQNLFILPGSDSKMYGHSLHLSSVEFSRLGG